MQVEHAALKNARDAWRNWKHMLYKKYLSEGKDAIPAYPQITKADWAKFKRVRATPEFAAKSFKQSELQKKNIHPTVWVGIRPLVKSGANAPETTCGHMQRGVMTELITLKTHVTPNCMK